ncbi:spore germination protein YaaH [Evansella vedderi]|uniref:Spore germination protein YaaH n=1 Tax=Evansella vedderi TaxID=38282 RepID=A0ABT9ZWZ4_9BACI|nr:S-layer homology domain-containing protein [Evansella vedderi]MDQ0255754.1 spore germination protein YaaH [Evansella vedderi]
MKLLRKTSLIVIFIAFLTIGAYQFSAQTEKFNMSYIFFGNPSTYIQQVDDTKGSLYVASPNYFDINKNGDLEIIEWRINTSFINEMHRRGKKVVPFLANHWDITAGVNGLEKRDKLARDIAAAIERYNLDGVNVDIEGVPRSGNHSGVTRNYRDEHTDLIRLLRQYIPKHKEVSVAVAGNPNGWTTGWHGFYDYKGMAQHADYLMIMAYDESWASPDSPIGPVSSLSFFERSLQFAINEGVPKNKIVNGLPFYGRIWKLDGPTLEGRNITGQGLSSRRVAPLVRQFNGRVHFDNRSQTPYATFTIPSGQEAFLGTTKLTRGEYVIWYENERSIKAKLQLIPKYGIKGTGSWALTHETPDTWNYYTLWLNGRYFTDVPHNHWGASNIMAVANRGWMGGTSSTTFSPAMDLTRAQGAVILVRALGLTDSTSQSNVFTDTRDHWARREIEIARAHGIVSGIGNNRFGPEDPLTREQLAAILQNIFKFDFNRPSRSPFPDISPNDWSYGSILAIQQKGYLSGFEDGTFRPRSRSTRAQMAALMHRMAAEFENYK